MKMERLKVTISKKMSEGIGNSLFNYQGDKDQLVLDYLSGKSRGYFNNKIDPIVMDLSKVEFVGIVWDLVEVEVRESFEEKKERWNRVVEELLESELSSAIKRGKILKKALKDFDIL